MAPSRTHNHVSDAAASLLNVWSCASSLGLRTRGGRTLLQKGESKDKLPRIFVMNVCPSHSRFRPISADIERSRKLSKEARFRALKAVARVRIPSGLQVKYLVSGYFASRLNSISSPVIHSGYTSKRLRPSPSPWPQHRVGRQGGRRTGRASSSRSCGRASAERPSHPRRTRWPSSRPCGAVRAGESRESSTLRLFVSLRRGPVETPRYSPSLH
jgi:hypothetical protein